MPVEIVSRHPLLAPARLVLPRTPRFNVSADHTPASRAAALALSLPASRAACFELGRIAGQLRAISEAREGARQGEVEPAGGEEGAVDRLLAEASDLLWPSTPTNRGSSASRRIRLDQQDVLGLGTLLASAEHGQCFTAAGGATTCRGRGGVSGAMRWLLGFVSLGNALLSIGAVGVCITIWPVLHFVTSPIRAMFARVLAVMSEVAIVLISNIVKALAHIAPAVVLWLCFCLAASAGAHEAPSTAARGALMAHGTALGALSVWLARDRGALDSRWQAPAAGGWRVGRLLWLIGRRLLWEGSAAVVLGAAAIEHGSQLLGFLATAAVFSALGFEVVPLGLTWIVGWNGEDLMTVSAAASALILAPVLALRGMGLTPQWLAPFRLGFGVFGSICLLLAGLIRASIWGMQSSAGSRHRVSEYVAINVAYSALVSGLIAAGTLTGTQSVKATGITFAFLFAGEKATELAVLVQGPAIWVMGLAASLAVWRVGMFLSANPVWLASMLGVGDLLLPPSIIVSQ